MGQGTGDRGQGTAGTGENHVPRWVAVGRVGGRLTKQRWQFHVAQPMLFFGSCTHQPPIENSRHRKWRWTLSPTVIRRRRPFRGTNCSVSPAKSGERRCRCQATWRRDIAAARPRFIFTTYALRLAPTANLKRAWRSRVDSAFYRAPRPRRLKSTSDPLASCCIGCMNHSRRKSVARETIPESGSPLSPVPCPLSLVPCPYRNKFLTTNTTFAGLSASRRIYHGNQYSP
jgi:hypothetical protein